MSPRHLAVLLPLLCATVMTASCEARTPSQHPTMKPSITYLHLLRNTPFFTALTTAQLRHVIDHSREWEVSAGAPILGNATAEGRDDVWVLLDGGWELHYRGQVLRSGHADAGKWFSAASLGPEAFELVANEHSYVMQIPAQDMDAMLAQGFDFTPHLDAGRALYRRLRDSTRPLTP